MGKKYEFTGASILTANDVRVKRIRAVRDITVPIAALQIKAGDLGGWIESESNLSQDGDCWVDDDSMVYGNAKVFENALVRADSKIYGDANVMGDAIVHHSIVHGKSVIMSNAELIGIVAHDTIMHGGTTYYL